ncbi:hypothetical protein BDV95DRAFT_679593 [Massariosphaeria phaeospora]|uniref:Aminoglycoside phosphotransferase domain-containing protein n=1 Tax=Massariosphaeria phaeospora TaxID=100035 RepID=A0A7C8M8V7_9PLEO|nr:hypothetical protein BDV95DRAFT_679593 [Massariosphaeria phaeospora]
MVSFRYARCWHRLSKRTMTNRNGHSTQSARSLLPDLKYGEDLFNYTRGRFVCDERHEMTQRHVRFNVDELARCAAVAVGAKSCTNIEKYPNGMYNKSMLLTMDDGSQVVARVPNPNARNVLGTPVPKVLAWSSRSHQNSVPGIELERVWPNMNIKDRFVVVKAIAGFQTAWTSVSFTKFGSLYFSKDLKDAPSHEPLYIDTNGARVTDERFAIGPSTGRESNDNGRTMIDFDRGPWRTLEEYHTAIGHREITSVNQLPDLPKSPITLCGPGTYQPTREKKLKALHCYLKLIKFHGDLHVANIFVDPVEPTKVVGLIDWQSTEISPLYFHGRQPHFMDYDGPPMNGLERPQPLEDLDSLDPTVKKQAETLYLQQSLCSLSNTLTYHKNPRLYAALQFQHTQKFLLLLLARNLLIDGEATYVAQTAELESTWKDFSRDDGSTFPFVFSAEEREELEADVEGAVRGMEVMRSIRESLGELFPEKGVVKADRYDEALDALEQMKEQVIDAFASNSEEREAWERAWPFGT